MDIYFYSSITSFIITLFAIPAIINVAEVKYLFDEPDERKLHKVRIPALGGIGIFGGIFLSLSFWLPYDVYGEFKYIFCGLLILFFLGVKDDLLPLTPGKKFLGQLLAAIVIVLFTDLTIPSFGGLMGIFELHPLLSQGLSIFTIIAIVNGFNLLDGINCLSGSIALVVTTVLGSWFMMLGITHYALFAFVTAGAVGAFLKYNSTPAKIIMGDTGAMLLGLICSVLSLKLLQHYSTHPSSPYFNFPKVALVVFSILILPLFDMLRVFVGRLLKGKSPFYPDRTHIHHLLLNIGYSHMKATYLLIVANISFILLALSLQEYVKDTVTSVIFLLLVAIGLTTLLQKNVKKRKATQTIATNETKRLSRSIPEKVKII